MSLLLPKLQSLSTPEEISDCLESVLDGRALDIESAELFVFALESQLKKNWFEPRLLIALVKLVQFYPEDDLDYDRIIYGSLVKALSEFPNPCLRQLLLLIPQKFQEIDIVKNIKDLMNHLSSSNYSAFWQLFHSISGGFQDIVPDIASKMQLIIFKDISIVFSTINKDLFYSFLGISDLQDLNQSIKTAVKIEENLVSFPKNDQTEPRPQEAEKLSHLKMKNVKSLLNQLNR